MVEMQKGTFSCTLLTPAGRVVDCRAGALTLPSHDGSMGVLRNHAPMLCKLAMGIVYVRQIPSKPDAFYFIDGGFARISENNISILTEEAISFQEMELEEAQKMFTRVKSLVVATEYMRTQTKDQMSYEKAALLVKLADLSGISDEKAAAN